MISIRGSPFGARSQQVVASAPGRPTTGLPSRFDGFWTDVQYNPLAISAGATAGLRRGSQDVVVVGGPEAVVAGWGSSLVGW